MGRQVLALGHQWGPPGTLPHPPQAEHWGLWLSRVARLDSGPQGHVPLHLRGGQEGLSGEHKACRPEVAGWGLLPRGPSRGGLSPRAVASQGSMLSPGLSMGPCLAAVQLAWEGPQYLGEPLRPWSPGCPGSGQWGFRGPKAGGRGWAFLA